MPSTMSRNSGRNTLPSEYFFCSLLPPSGSNFIKYDFSIKLGVIEDHSNRTRLAKLLRFLTSHDESNPSSLEEYVERMKEGQEKIFFCAGNGIEDVKNSPFMERLVKKGYEVIYLTEPVDEYTIQG